MQSLHHRPKREPLSSFSLYEDKAEWSYAEDFPVLGNEEGDVVGEGELARSRGEGDEEVVVDEVVAAESDENQRLVD